MIQRKYNKLSDNFNAAGPVARITPDNTIAVELWYPRSDGHPRVVEVGMTCVRAADSIQIEYDFARDGWSIRQARRFSWTPEEPPDPQWTEVAFVQAWASKSDDHE